MSRCRLRYRGRWGRALGCPCSLCGRTRSVAGVPVRKLVRRRDRRVAAQELRREGDL